MIFCGMYKIQTGLKKTQKRANEIFTSFQLGVSFVERVSLRRQLHN